jgi:hypothetical protein
MVFDVSTILSMDDEDFQGFVEAFLKDQRISINQFGLIMGRSKTMGHKYLKGKISIGTRKKILEKLGTKKIMDFYLAKEGVCDGPDSPIAPQYPQAEKDLKEIFLYGDAETKEAISVNLRTFVKKIRSEKRVVELEGKMETLERRLDHLEHVNDPRVPNVASGGAGTTTLPEAT